MNITLIVIAAAVVAFTGIFVGLGLGIFGEKFKVEIDERESKIRAELPGNNCGGCGFPGCDGLAKAIHEGRAGVDKCIVGGQPVADRIAAIMGTEAGIVERRVAFVKCTGTCDKTGTKFDYYGISDCAKAFVVPGNSSKSCSYGCMGLGSCVRVCTNDAIHIRDGIAVVDKEKCFGCGSCAKVCPKNLIEIIPYDALYKVACNSQEKGRAVMDNCKAGCIACTLCTRECESGAITMEGNVAHIDYSKCTNCGKCSEKCPKKVIL